MKPKFFKYGILALLTGATLITTPALADSWKRGDHDRGRDHSRYDNDKRYRFNGDRDYDRHVYYRPYNQPRNVYVIDNRDRVIIHDYVRVKPMPWGHAKRYVVGRPLPSYVVYEPVPYDVVMRLRPIPREYRYVRVDNDILLISLLTREVLDAVNL
jgi:hypothetical protein